MIKYPKPVDLTKFQGSQPREARYGLPAEVRYCQCCVISNQRPSSSMEFKSKSSDAKNTIAFSQENICDACKLAKNKSSIDWQNREKQLQELCNRFRKTDGSYDCIVPGSGGKDSFYAAHVLRYKYNMNPLTVTWSPHIYTDWGRKNFDAWIHAGFDNYLMTPNGKVHRLLTRLAVDNLLHPFQPFIIGQKCLAPKMSDLFNIPLVFYGENEAEYGNPLAEAYQSTRDTSYFAVGADDEVFLGGVSSTELVEEFGISKSDLNPYKPIDLARLEQKSIEVHYLGFYLRWHPQSCYYYAVEHGEFEAAPERTVGTYSKYNSIDDKIDDLHYYTTGIKFGLGRASYDAAQEIRSGDIERLDGVKLVAKFDHEYPTRFLTDIFKYLSIDEKSYGSRVVSLFEEPIMDKEYFDKLCDTFRSPHLWNYDEKIGWSLRFPLESN